MTDSERILEALTSLGIAFDRAEHPPAGRIEDCMPIAERMGALMCKNFFLTTRHRPLYCLCVTRPEARFRTADVSKQAGTPRLTFADEASLARLLHARPGAVSPLGLLFDEGREVRLLVDASLASAGRLAFHPCDNTQTVAFSSRDLFEVFLPAVGHGADLVRIRDDSSD